MDDSGYLPLPGHVVRIGDEAHEWEVLESRGGNYRARRTEINLSGWPRMLLIEFPGDHVPIRFVREVESSAFTIAPGSIRVLAEEEFAVYWVPSDPTITINVQPTDEWTDL